MGFSFLLPYFHISENYVDDSYSEIVKCIKSNAGNNTFRIPKTIWGCQQRIRSYEAYGSVTLTL